MLYLTEGDYINAGLSALSIIPGADAFTKTGKASKVLGNGIVESGLKHLDNVADGIKKLVKKADDAIDLEKHLPKKLLTEEAETFTKKADKVVDDVVEDAAKAIKSGSNTVTIGENNQSIVYRVIRSDENPMNGLTAKNPTRGMSIEGHIVSGSRNKGSQFISTTTDINVANKYALQDGCRIVEIDLNKLPSNVNIYDLSTAAGRNTYLKGVTAKNFAAKSSEVLLEGYIPSDAINLR